MDSLEMYWSEILNIIRQKVPKQTFDTWFLPLNPISSGNGSYKVGCPNHFFMDWFMEHHLHTLDSAGSTFLDKPTVFSLEVIHSKDNTGEDYFDPVLSKTNRPQRSASIDQTMDQTANVPKQNDRSLFLNPDYTLSRFVVGSGSDLAYAAATAISRKPGFHFNPLFIHGGVGLGNKPRNQAPQGHKTD